MECHLLQFCFVLSGYDKQIFLLSNWLLNIISKFSDINIFVLKNAELVADPDQLPRTVESGLGLYHLLRLSVNAKHAGEKFQQMAFLKVFLFFQKIGFDISCKLSPEETICM